MSKLLSRDDFRERCLARDQNTCVMCGAIGVPLSVHHIIERRLWTGEIEFHGYFEDNGATVCDPCHIKCEQTVVSCEDVRKAAGITKTVIPSNAYDDAEYTKWLDIILPNGQRLKGPLFYDDSVQKILGQGGVLNRYSKYVKYPRTPHLPWSPGMNSDDRRIENLDAFIGQDVWVTEKCDGENASVYNDYYHARSLETDPHESRSRLKAFIAEWQHSLADDERICGENAFAQHSIRYDDANPLPHFFLGFSMWRKDMCLSADETLENFEILGISPVKTLYRGIWNEDTIQNLYDEKRDWSSMEGYVGSQKFFVCRILSVDGQICSPRTRAYCQASLESAESDTQHLVKLNINEIR